MPYDIKGVVKPPFLPPEGLNRQEIERPQAKLPPAIRAFAWICAGRSITDFVFAFIVIFASNSELARFLGDTFGSRFKLIPPVVEFLVSGFVFAFIARKWLSRDWRIRWISMFLSGAFAVRSIVLVLADRSTGTQGRVISAQRQTEMIVHAAFDLLVCAYLAFYPGMAEAFKERYR
jgi:hypothetical protein